MNGKGGEKKISEHGVEGKRVEQEHGMECSYQEHLSYMSDKSCRDLKQYVRGKPAPESPALIDVRGLISEQ